MDLDISGVVVGTGKAVTELQVGDCIYRRPDLLRNGAFTEYIVVKADLVALNWTISIQPPLAGLTATEKMVEDGHTVGKIVIPIC